jgi:hypothetical protein
MQKQPPKYVPTLTQVIPPAQLAAKAASLPAPALVLVAQQQQELADQLRRQLVAAAQRHIDAQLERRVREAVSQLALQHAQNMLEAMAPTVEATVATVMDEAVAQALREVAGKR